MWRLGIPRLLGHSPLVANSSNSPSSDRNSNSSKSSLSNSKMSHKFSRINNHKNSKSSTSRKKWLLNSSSSRKHPRKISLRRGTSSGQDYLRGPKAPPNSTSPRAPVPSPRVGPTRAVPPFLARPPLGTDLPGRPSSLR